MWNKFKPLLSTALALGMATLPAAAQAQEALAKQVSASVLLEGTVVDANNGIPLEGVYIRQTEALNATFSDRDGKFSLPLTQGFAQTVTFEVEGYETIAFPFQQQQDKLRINLQPLTQFSSSLPSAHQDKSDPLAGSIFGSQFTAFYQMNYSIFNQSPTSITGLILNEFGLTTDLRPFQDALTFRGRFFRSRMPVDLANFPFQPAFYVNRLQAKIGAGQVNKISDPLELYWGGDMILDYRSPDNRNAQDKSPIPFTGSLLDYEQTRLGLGGSVGLGWNITKRLSFFPEVSLYPLTFNFVNRDNSKINYSLAGDLGAKLRFEIASGIYAVAQYNTQLWYVFGDNSVENNHFFHLGISLDPWAIAEQLL